MSNLHDPEPITPGPSDPVSRRRFLKALGGLGAVGGVSYLVARGALFREPSREPAPPSTPVPGQEELVELSREITRGGPPKDGIPPIEDPRFLSASEARFLAEDDVVFGLVHAGEVRAYPQLVLVWHEIANDRFPDGPMTVTYCPLTGSAVAFRGRAAGGRTYTFGTSGDLVNSNLLMYDRQTDSRWPQILARAILGPSFGRWLEEIPLDWTTWGRWRAAHPDTVVLSTETGAVRDYGTDPYGSYTPLSGYYAPGTGRGFPVTEEDPRFDDKEVVIGVKHGTGRLAVRKSTLRRRHVAHAGLEGDPVSVLYDPALDEGRAYRPVTGALRLRLSPADEPGRYVDDMTDSLWDSMGQSLIGPLRGERLERLVSYDVMWFSWVAFFPQTEVVG
ncbi:MAG: DUF3179 domain-containing protein [Actinomycetota bacterium]